LRICQDLQNTENLLFSWFWFISGKGYKLWSAKEKGAPSRARLHQAQASFSFSGDKLLPCVKRCQAGKLIYSLRLFSGIS
jgi:hypothetical protein